MSQNVEAIIDEQGQVRLLRPLRFPTARRAVVMILDDDPLESARVSEPAPVNRSCRVSSARKGFFRE